VKFSTHLPSQNRKKAQAPVKALEFYDCDQHEYGIDDLCVADIKNYQNLEALPFTFSTDKDVLGWAAAMMSESPLAFALLKNFEAQNWQICLSDVGNGSYHIDLDAKVLEIDGFGIDCAAIGRSTLFKSAIIMNFARAMRDIWHETHQKDDFMLKYAPKQALLLERVRAADCDAAAVMIAWELRSAGYKDIWRHALSLDQADMAQMLVNVIDYNGAALYNGMAIAHLYRQWYADPARVNAVDHDTLTQMDSIIDEGGALGADEPELGVIEALSTLPDGTSYLSGVSETIMRDPFFCKIDEPINEAHLMHIIYDNKVTLVEGVPFRDERLAQMIFPAITQ